MILTFSSDNEIFKILLLQECLKNICFESHLRDAIEHGFNVIVVKDATTELGSEGTKAAYTNYGFIATDVLTTQEIITRLEQNVPINKI